MQRWYPNYNPELCNLPGEMQPWIRELVPRDGINISTEITVPGAAALGL